MIYQQHYEAFYEICYQISNHRQKLAKESIESFIQKKIDTETATPALMTHIIAESLLKRIDHQLLKSKNIYIENFDIPQINMFYKMIEAYPHVRVSHDIANQYMLAILNDLTEATIVDIGIGKAAQIIKLLKSLDKSNRNIKKVNIIGLEISAENIRDSEINISEIKKELSFELKFYSFPKMAEEISERDLKEIKEIAGKNLLINSAYTIHHTYPSVSDKNKRTEFFCRLKALNPLLLTLIEPNSDHDVENLARRFHNCWEHFGNVFQLIDESSLQKPEKFSVKEKFFGRELRDIFGVSDHFRCERHERLESWILRLNRAGFKAFENNGITTELPENSDFIISEGLCRLRYRNIPLIAVLAYKGNN